MVTCNPPGFPGGSEVKASACIAGERPGFDPGVGKIPWRRKWQPTPVFLPGESHGREEAGVLQSTGGKGSDTTSDFTFSFAFNPPGNEKQWTCVCSWGVGHSQSSFCHPLAPEGANACAPRASSLKYSDSFHPVYFTWFVLRT